MPVRDGGEDRERIEELRETWQQYDETGDVDLVKGLLAEDVVFMPPGESSIKGKVNCLDWMAPHEHLNADSVIEQVSEEVFISGDLAIDRGGMTIRAAEDGTVQSSHKDLDVYRRDENGEWKYLIWIGNNQL